MVKIEGIGVEELVEGLMGVGCGRVSKRVGIFSSDMWFLRW